MKTKSTLPGALTLFVGGTGLLLLTYLGLPAHQVRLMRGAIIISRADHPILFWGYEILCFAIGAFFIGLSIRQARAFFRWQRDFEQQAYDDFIRQKKGSAQTRVDKRE